MHKIHTLILALTLMAGACFAQEQQFPTRRILPEDIVQSSIHLVPFTTNRFTVLWTYTEVGATNMLAFNEPHTDEKVRTDIGSSVFVNASAQGTSQPGESDYAEWREGWLKHRTDKIVGVSEEDAKKIMAGLRK